MGLLNTLQFLLNHPLNERRKMQALLDYLKWQIGGRLVSGAVAHEWIGGARLLARPGETGVTANIYAGLHEFEEMAFVLHALKPNDLFVDIGANAGEFTILAAFVAKANVVAFEPVPEAYARLCANVRLNDLESSVRCFNMAVGQREGTIAFTSDQDTVNHVVADAEAAVRPLMVSMTTLDNVLGTEEPRVVKIDVEGYEHAVLQGGKNMLAGSSVLAVIMEINGSGVRYGISDSRIEDEIRTFGFEAVHYKPFERKLVNYVAAINPGNKIFVRNRPLVSERLRTAPIFTVNGQRL